MFLPPANFEKCNLQHAKRKMKLQFQIEVLWLAQIYKLHPRIFRVSLKYCLSTCQKFGNLPNLLPMLSQSTKASIRATWTWSKLVVVSIKAVNLFVTLQNRFAQPTNVPILMKTILLPVNVSCIIANILFFQAIVVPYFGSFNKVPNFGCCNVGGVFANLWRIHCLQWHSIDLARIAQTC